MANTVFFQFVGIALSFLVFYYIYKTHSYLVSLDSCDCAPQLYSDRLKNLEVFYLLLSVSGILVNFFKFFVKDTEAIYKGYVKLVLAWILIVYIVHIVFIYNTYMFYSNVKADCACSKGWEKKFIYIQAIVYGLPIFLVVFTLIFGLVVSLLRTMTIMSSMSSYKPKSKGRK
jgi:RsiW-degrading membrane proteinase PrsW (M82 family)